MHIILTFFICCIMSLKSTQNNITTIITLSSVRHTDTINSKFFLFSISSITISNIYFIKTVFNSYFCFLKQNKTDISVLLSVYYTVFFVFIEL